jgi:hypothetical protein
MAADQPSRGRKIRRLEHPIRTLVFLAVCAAIAGASFALGAWVRSPDAAVLAAKDQSLPVFAAVESRAVTDDVRIQGEVVGTQPVPVSVSAPEGAQRAIVTRVTAHQGDFLPNGALLGLVSDRPVFVFSTEVPLFRNLASGDRGSDVASLQKSLGVHESGQMDYATLRAVRSIYAAAGVEPPGGPSSGTYVSTAEFFTLASVLGPPTVVSIASPAAELDAEHPFAVLGVGLPYVSVRASVSEAARITLGEPVSIEGSSGKSTTGSVTAIGDFQQTATKSGRPPGRDVRIDMGHGASPAAGDSVSVLFGSKQTPDTAVPTLAVRSDSSGDFVLSQVGSHLARVNVIVIRNADGWTAVKSEKLRPGDEVLVSG